MCVLGLSQHSHDSLVSQLVQAWACEPLSQWNLRQSFWETDLHATPLTLSPKALEAFMPITEDKLPENGGNTEQTEPKRPGPGNNL